MAKYIFIKKILTGFFVSILILGGLGYGGFYLWQHRDQYFFKGEDLQTEQDVIQKQVKQDSENSANNDSEEDNNDEQDSDDEYFMPKIHQSDCDNECEGRKAVDSEYKYCREICGFNEIKDEKEFDQTNEKNSEERDCDDIDDSFAEDVCWKEKAIREKMDKYCDEIYSEDLAKVCHNRVTEEIMK